MQEKEQLTDSATDTEQGYLAFISYKHVKSTSFAEDFELALKRYAKGLFKMPDKIFRDEQFLKPGSNLTIEIKKALIKSEYLILLASVEAADSVWVSDELWTWCVELGRKDRLIIVLTSGHIAVNSVTKELDWSHTDALPAFLKDHLPALPLFVDLSGASDKKSRSFSNTAYKSAINSIAATIRNVSPNELAGKEWKIRRRNTIIAWSAAVVLIALLISVIISNMNLNTALTISRSRQLAALSQLQDLPESLLSAAEAIDLNKNNESTYSLMKVMTENHMLSRHLIKLPDGMNDLVYKNELVFIATDGILTVNLQTEAVAHTKFPSKIQFSHIGIFKNGVIVGSSQNTLWDIAKQKVIAHLDTDISALAIDDINKYVFAGLVNGKVCRLNMVSDSISVLYEHGGVVTDVKVSNDGVVTTALNSKKSLIYYAENKITLLPNPLFSANALDISPDSKSVIVAFENKVVACYSLPKLEKIWSNEISYSGSAVTFSKHDSLVAVGSTGGNITLFDQNGTVIKEWMAVQGRVHKLAWVKDTLLSGGSDGWVKEWLPKQIVPYGKTLMPGSFLFWSQDSLYVADSSRLWNVTSNTSLTVNYSSDKVLAANGSCMVIQKENSFYIFDRDARRTIYFPEPPPDYKLEDVVVSTNGETVAACWSSSGLVADKITGKVAIWHPKKSTLHWLTDTPEFPEKIALFENELVAATGKGAISVWELKNNGLVSQSNQTTGEPIQNMAFQDKNNLVTGMLLGRVEGRSIKTPGTVVKLNTSQTGSNYGLLVLPDKSLLTVDVNGIKWFDASLNYLGPVYNVETGPLVRQIAYNDRLKLLAVRFQRGVSIVFPLDLEKWGKSAYERGTRIITNVH